MLRFATLFLVILLAATVFAQKGGLVSLSLQSSAFKEGADIPRQYTCEGADISPALAWGEAPQKTQSFALIADDPDAPVGTWVHWVAWDIPAAARQLPENVAKTAGLPGGGHQGTNDFRNIGYGGPCPPPGKPHRYYFKLYALDVVLPVRERMSRDQLLAGMNGHILAEGQLMGTYGR